MDEKKTIMVVDDSNQIRRILKFNLEKKGYNIKLASNGKEAVEYALDENPPDLIILDIMMPKMDGYEVIRQIRNSDIVKHIPVIFLTAKAQKKDILKGIEAGSDDYVVKPFKFVDLHSKVEKLLSMYDGHSGIEKDDRQRPEKNKPLTSEKASTLLAEITQKDSVSAKKGAPERALAAIVITDIVGFSGEMEENEEHTYTKLLTHNKMIRKSISENNGKEIKTVGDSFLIRFNSAVDAVKTGLNIQNELLKHNKYKKKADQISVRIGIHIGDILIIDNDVFGNGVNIASRIVPFAEPGGICISEDVYNIVKNSIDMAVSSMGKRKLKNIEDPPEIFKILIPPES